MNAITLRATLQLSLVGYPMVRERVEAGRLLLHGWHYVIEEGEVHVFDLCSGGLVPASSADHSGTGPFDYTPVDAGRRVCEVSGIKGRTRD